MTTKTRTRRPKHTIEDMRKEFKKRGFTLLTKEYYGTKQTLACVCDTCGHKWKTCYNNFYRSNIGCKRCYLTEAAETRPIRKIILKNDLFCMAEVARVLSVKYEDFRTHVMEGTLPTGSVKFGPKNYYTADDIAKIEEMLL